MLSFVGTLAVAVAVVAGASLLINRPGDRDTGPKPVPATLQLRWQDTKFRNADAGDAELDGTVEGRQNGFLYIRIAKSDLGWQKITEELGWPPPLPGLVFGGLKEYSMTAVRIGEDSVVTQVDRVFLGGSPDHALVRIPIGKELASIAAQASELELGPWITNAAMSPEGLQSVPIADAK
jgi:hypothetical protein